MSTVQSWKEEGRTEIFRMAIIEKEDTSVDSSVSGKAIKYSNNEAELNKLK